MAKMKIEKKTKIYLEYDPTMGFSYQVIKLVNRISPTIGERLSKETISGLYLTCGSVEVIITERKK